MMRTVWKFPLNDWVTEIDIPEGAKVVHVARQNGLMTLWAEVDSTKPTWSRGVAIVGTGHPILVRDATHVGSILDGEFVWHIYLQDEVSPCP